MIRVSRSGPVSQAVEIGADAGHEIRTIAGPKFEEYGAAVAEQQQKSKTVAQK